MKTSYLISAITYPLFDIQPIKSHNYNTNPNPNPNPFTLETPLTIILIPLKNIKRFDQFYYPKQHQQDT